MSTQALSLLPGGCAVLRAVDPDDGGSPPLSPLPGSRVEAGPRSSLALTLFDTWPRSLWHAGLLLVGDGGRLLLLGADRPGAPLAEIPGAAPPRFAWELPAGSLAETVGPLLELRALDAELQLRVDQRWWWLRNADDKIVVRLLEQRWEGGPRTLQLKPLRGYGEELEGARALLPGRAWEKRHPLQLALEACAPPPRAWTTKPAFGFSARTPARTAAVEMVLRMLELSRETEAGLLADRDTEFLHDYRVLLRRARSVLSVMKGVFGPEDTEAIKDGLRSLAGRTGRLRDLDVHLLGRAAQEARAPQALRSDLGPLFDDVQRERDAELAALSRVLRSRAYTREHDRLCERVLHAAPGPEAARSMRKMADRRLERALIKVLGRGRAITPQTPDEDVHELRIDCKKLRYALEFFRDLYPADEVRRLVKSMKGLQDLLGAFNDASVQQEALLAWLDAHPSVPVRSAAAIGALYQALHGEQLALRGRVERVFAEFDSSALPAIFKALTGRRLKGAA